MLRLAILLASVLAVSTPALAAPSLTLSSYQVTPGTAIVVHGRGFTPRGIVISHLTRPDATEYPTMTFEADVRGEFSHTVTIVPTMIGTYEIRMIDRESTAEATTRYMFVAVGSQLPPKPAADAMPAAFAGVWQGRAGTDGGETLVALSAGTPGAVVGTVAYPSRLCGGELWLMGVYGESVQLGEVITYGAERCTGRGIVTLTPASPGSVGFSWRNAHEAAGQAATGALTRR